jgi:hypothetical protein
MSTWEYDLIQTATCGKLWPAERADAPAAVNAAAALISERAAAGWALRAVHPTRAGTHLLFRRPLADARQD